jgi:hypothetical protein
MADELAASSAGHKELAKIPGGVLMRDLAHYSLGFGPFGAIAHAVFVRAKLKMIFEFRKQTLVRRFGML